MRSVTNAPLEQVPLPTVGAIGEVGEQISNETKCKNVCWAVPDHERLGFAVKSTNPTLGCNLLQPGVRVAEKQMLPPPSAANPELFRSSVLQSLFSRSYRHDSARLMVTCCRSLQKGLCGVISKEGMRIRGTMVK